MYKLSKNQAGVVQLPILVAVIALLGFLFISSNAPLKDSLFSMLYPKPASNASSDNQVEKGVLSVSQDHILVKFKDNVGQAKKQEVLSQHNLKEIDEIKQIGVKIVNIPGNKNPEEVVNDLLSKNPDSLDFASIDAIVPALYIPNDPEYPNMWQHKNINSAVAWDSANGSDVTVAIVDSGVDPTHPDLQANLVPGWNFYDNNSNTADVHGHGTAVAGSAAAIGDNNNQIAGVSWNAKIMPLRIAYVGSDGKAYASTSNMAKAITYAADKGVRLVNVSYGAQGWCVDSDRTISSAAQYLYNKGGLTTFAAGNFSNDTGNCPNNQTIITSSATDSNDYPASFTTYGNNVDVGSPGVGVWLTRNGGSFGTGNGTSFASPITMGVLALIMQANSGLSPSQVTDVLIKSADDLGTVGFDKYFGNGRINAGKAVELAKTYIGNPSPTPTPTSTPTSTPTPVPSSPPSETTPPTVSVTSPANGATLTRNSNITITANASDNVGVTKVEFLVDGVLKCTDTTSAYSCTTKIGGKPGASHTISAKAYDGAGNYSSDLVTVTAK